MQTLEQSTEMRRQSGSAPQPRPAMALCKQASPGPWEAVLPMVGHCHLMHICPLIKLFLQPFPAPTWPSLPPSRPSANANSSMKHDQSFQLGALNTLSSAPTPQPICVSTLRRTSWAVSCLWAEAASQASLYTPWGLTTQRARKGGRETEGGSRERKGEGKHQPQTATRIVLCDLSWLLCKTEKMWKLKELNPNLKLEKKKYP